MRPVVLNDVVEFVITLLRTSLRSTDRSGQHMRNVFVSIHWMNSMRILDGFLLWAHCARPAITTLSSVSATFFAPALRIDGEWTNAKRMQIDDCQIFACSWNGISIRRSFFGESSESDVRKMHLLLVECNPMMARAVLTIDWFQVEMRLWKISNFKIKTLFGNSLVRNEKKIENYRIPHCHSPHGRRYHYSALYGPIIGATENRIERKKINKIFRVWVWNGQLTGQFRLYASWSPPSVIDVRTAIVKITTRGQVATHRLALTIHQDSLCIHYY